MKLISIESSRLTALFHMSRRSGQQYLPFLMAAIADRYKFAAFPNSAQELSVEPIVFQHGLFNGSAIGRLEIYHDGVSILSASNTDLLDEFLKDLLSWMNQEFGFSEFSSREVTRIHESVIWIESNPAILGPLRLLEPIQDRLAAMLRENYGLSLAYQPMGYTLVTDHLRSTDLKPIPYRLERRLAAAFSFNQFVASASLRTNQHLEILADLETMFGGPLPSTESSP